jgi:Domain of unknown function (DUF2382)
MEPILPVNSINSMASPPSELLPPVEKAASVTSLLDEKTISLLEERLVIDRHRIKVGEVIVRKEIETRIIEVPVRREKLIVEQISPEHKRLVEVDLGETNKVDEVEGVSYPIPPAISGEFSSVEEAIQFLNTILVPSGSTNSINANSAIQKFKVSIEIYAI